MGANHVLDSHALAVSWGGGLGGLCLGMALTSALRKEGMDQEQSSGALYDSPFGRPYDC